MFLRPIGVRSDAGIRLTNVFSRTAALAALASSGGGGDVVVRLFGGRSVGRSSCQLRDRKSRPSGSFPVERRLLAVRAPDGVSRGSVLANELFHRSGADVRSDGHTIGLMNGKLSAVEWDNLCILVRTFARRKSARTRGRWIAQLH